jgi:hypothetical protein
MDVRIWKHGSKFLDLRTGTVSSSWAVSNVVYLADVVETCLPHAGLCLQCLCLVLIASVKVKGRVLL